MFVHETKSFEELLRTSAAELLQERKTCFFSTKSEKKLRFLEQDWVTNDVASFMSFVSPVKVRN